MDNVIAFTIPGSPVPWARPRARIVKPHFKASFIHFYTQKEQEIYARTISYAAIEAMAGRPPIEESCEMTVRAYIVPPASWSNKKSALALSGAKRPPSKPDIDNFFKIAGDGCNGIVYRDDSLICTLHAEKHYSEDPRLEIEVRLFQPPILI